MAMTEFSTTLWIVCFPVLLGVVLSQKLSPDKALKLTTFHCHLNTTDVKWKMQCESKNFEMDSSYKFFQAKLFGVFDPVSPATFYELLQSASLSASELYLCDSRWRDFGRIDPYVLLQHCANYKKYLQKLISVLNETSLINAEICHTSKVILMLNIISDCSHLNKVTIRDNSLSNIFSFPVYPNNSVISLSLKRNKIEIITDGSFRNFSRLLFLDLSENLLKYLHKNVFDGITTISELDISFNLIESISSDAFINLVSLKRVLAMNNNLKYINQDLFRFNNVLGEIDISNNDLKNLPPTLFHNLPDLKNVSCSNCSLYELHRNMFANSSEITLMNFSSNNLQFLQDDAFKELKSLSILDLGNNKISDLNENLFQNQFYLLFLSMAQNEIRYMKKGLFIGAPNIRHLDMSQNRIRMLNDDHIKNFTDLEYFDLSRNMMQSVELGLTTDVKLRNLDLSHNLITKFNVGWKRLVFMEILILDNNNLRSLDLPPCIPTVKQTLTFSFKYNNITELNIDALILDETRAKEDKTMAGCFFNGLPKNFVDLTHNPLFCDCHLFTFYRYVRKTSPRQYQLEMFMNKENLTCGGPPTLSNYTLISLPDDILYCPLTRKCPKFCFCGVRGKDNLIFVNCSSENLKEFPSIIPNGASVLYFNDNEMKSMLSLDSDLWKNLRELHIDRNLLTNLDDWNIPVSLRYLSVRGNKLKTLPNSLMKFITKQSDFQLFLGNNDRNCNCDRKELKNFLIQNMPFVEDNEDILCVVTNNGTSTFLPLTSVPDSNLCPLNSDGMSYYEKQLIISLCVLFTFLTSLMLVYYKQRQLILSFLYIHCDDLFRLCYSDEEFDENHVFDAFVAYSSTDRDIVMKLIEELETNVPFFKLCIHERNWLPGKFITDNIVNSVQCSKRTIVILSSSFINSPWFNLELRAAVFKMSKDKMSRIIVILTEKSVSLDNIDTELRHVISKRTYLVWGERWFWEKLRYAMPRKKYTCLICNLRDFRFLAPRISNENLQIKIANFTFDF